jgi:hypothetical protein
MVLPLGLRAWRLITLVTAKEVRSTYCSHVHAKQLGGDFWVEGCGAGGPA